MDIKSINTAPGMDEEQEEDLTQDNIRRLHNEFGVVDPDPETVKSSDTGVGTRITLKNKENKVLASLVIGKQVGDQASQHYVRYPDKDTVYIVNIDTGKVSTKFEDWIERNLLGMNTMDLKQVHIQDYSVVPAAGGLAGEARWRVSRGLQFQRRPGLEADEGPDVRCGQEGHGSASPQAGQELDTKKLDDLKLAIDDLKIVDVERKPAEVPADLRLASSATLPVSRPWQERGFFPRQRSGWREEPFPHRVEQGRGCPATQQRRRYVLRFGESTGQSSRRATKTRKTPRKSRRRTIRSPDRTAICS